MSLPYEFVDERLHERRERVFLVLAGLFIGAMAMLNIIGISRFIKLLDVPWLGGGSIPIVVAIGVLPYPLTFFCTDLIGEFYGRRRAAFVVLVGLLVNGLVIATMALGASLPGIGLANPPWQDMELASPVALPGGTVLEGKNVEVFDIIYGLTAASVVASMVAYLAAQLCDVYVFHFWKRLTRGRHLWLRNNASTMTSQLVDTTLVIFITFWAQFSAGERTLHDMLLLIGGGYAFKVAAALIDTGPIYLAVAFLSKYLKIDPTREHAGWDNETAGSGASKQP